MIEILSSFFSRFSAWTLVLLSAAFTILGDWFGKMWSVNLNKANFILCIVFYGLSSVVFMFALLKEGLTITSVVWSILTIIGFLVIGIVIFKEQLSVIQTVALVLGVISLILFSFSE